MPLLVALVRHRQLAAGGSEGIPDVKIATMHFDRCHAAVVQYVDFLIQAYDVETYAQVSGPLAVIIAVDRAHTETFLVAKCHQFGNSLATAEQFY